MHVESADYVDEKISEGCRDEEKGRLRVGVTILNEHGRMQKAFERFAFFVSRCNNGMPF